ncbi:MAG: type sorting protein, partial [Bacteroidota bacterium]|nr:type sorting protein [Bacteroidota bacterium]
MKKLFTVFLSFTSLVCFSQRLVDEICLGTPLHEEILMFHENNDSTTTIITQNAINDSSGYYSIYKLIKLDKNKRILFIKELDSLNQHNSVALSDNILFDPDGAMFVIGITNVLGYKYDKDGNVLWKADSLHLANTYGAVRATQKPDGGYILYSPFMTDREIVSVTKDGHFLWSTYMSLANIIPPNGYNQYLLTVEGLFNKNTLLTAKVSRPSFTHIGDDTSRTMLYLLDSSGVLIVEDSSQNISTSYYQSITDYSSHHYIVRYNSSPVNSSRPVILLDPTNLSIVRYDSMISLNRDLMTTYNNRFDDTSRIYMYPYVSMDSMIYCINIYSNRLWSYKMHHFNPHASLETIPLLLDNNRVFADRSLIDNGVKIWESNVEVRNTIFYRGKTWYISSYNNATIDYNGKDISYIISYDGDISGIFFNVETIKLVQIIDIQTGLVKEKMIIDPKPDNAYIFHYGAKQIFIATTSELPCNYGGSDIYFAYYSGIYNSVTGVAFIDYNNNNVKNAAEPTYPWGYAYTRSARDSQMMHLYSTGQFLFYTDTGNYKTHIALYNDYFTISPAQFNSSHTTYGYADTAYFALHPIPGKNDLEIKLLNNWWTSLGRVNKYTVSLTNKGAFPASGKVKLVLDQRLLSLTVTPPPTSVNGDTMIWAITNLPPAQTLSATLHFTGATPPILNAGDTLFSQAWIINDSVDIVPADNYTTLKEAVLSSYDPNEKTILSGNHLTPAQIANGDYISYIIHFQNKGNDTAFRIIVV